MKSETLFIIALAISNILFITYSRTEYAYVLVLALAVLVVSLVFAHRTGNNEINK